MIYPDLMDLSKDEELFALVEHLYPSKSPRTNWPEQLRWYQDRLVNTLDVVGEALLGNRPIDPIAFSCSLAHILRSTVQTQRFVPVEDVANTRIQLDTEHFTPEEHEELRTLRKMAVVQNEKRKEDIANFFKLRNGIKKRGFRNSRKAGVR